MKFMTLNTHSLEEPGYVSKKEKFINVFLVEQPDILALQEVNQSMAAAIVDDKKLPGFFRCPDFTRPVREDNHAYALAKEFHEAGISCYWTWISAKTGYDKYDEGMALFSLKPILEARQKLTSTIDDYQNWKTRRMLGIRTEGLPDDWFFTVHMGWWKDEEEPFAAQWEHMQHYFAHSEFKEKTIWLMGDFNSPSDAEGEGYSLVTKSGWQDTYMLAESKDSGVTVEKEIDGWRSGDAAGEAGKSVMRLDYIYCNKEQKIETSQVVFNGKKYPVVSDHYGVMIELEDK